MYYKTKPIKEVYAKLADMQQAAKRREYEAELERTARAIARQAGADWSKRKADFRLIAAQCYHVAILEC